MPDKTEGNCPLCGHEWDEHETLGGSQGGSMCFFDLSAYHKYPDFCGCPAMPGSVDKLGEGQLEEEDYFYRGGNNG
jgi:hypothetical protein